MNNLLRMPNTKEFISFFNLSIPSNSTQEIIFYKLTVQTMSGIGYALWKLNGKEYLY